MGYLLHAETRAATLREGEHTALNILPSLVVLIQPALRNECVRIGEGLLIVVGNRSRHTYSIALRNNVFNRSLVPLSTEYQVLLGRNAGCSCRDTI